MRAYLLKRLLAMIPTVLGITVITFLIIQLAPGNPAEFKVRMAEGRGLDPQHTAQIIEQTKKLYGLDKPIHVRYLIWLKQVATFNFGDSYKDHRPVREKILERVPISLQLEIISLFLVYLLAVPIGVFSAVKQGSWSDRLVTLILFILYSLPSFWVAMILITFLGGGDFLDLFPVYGLSRDGADKMTFFPWLLDRLHHLVLPVACLTYGGLAYVSRQMRGGMLEVIRQDYIRTARAKGLSEKVVVFKHAFRNSLIPIITMLAILFPAMIGGSVIIESIFSIPGMGLLSFEAILSRDYPTIMGVTTIAAFLTLVGILAAASIPLMRGRIDSAKWAEANATAGTIKSAVRVYFAEHGEEETNSNVVGTLDDDTIQNALGFTDGDLTGTYFVPGDYEITAVDENGNATITVTASQDNAPETGTSKTLSPDGTWE
jgi:peptide/nickel transport system permease protein